MNNKSKLDDASSSLSSASTRVRSASVGRSRDDLRARYWAFLFDNLHRAVDEIYQNCEKDESVVECKEAIMILDNYTREFNGLIEWLNLNKRLESTPPPQRPTSLAWEVRKSIPAGERLFWNIFFNQRNRIIRKESLTKDFESCDEKENIYSNKIVNQVDKCKGENKEGENNIECNNKISSDEEKKGEIIDEKEIEIKNEPIVQEKTEQSSSVIVKRTAASIVANGISSFKQPTNSVCQVRKIQAKSKSASAVINKNYFKDTNASRLRNVRNSLNSNSNLRPDKILSARNTTSLISSAKSTALTKENLNNGKSKTKKIKDADGWELVRGRQRFKNSPPKVIIVDDKDEMVKTNSDGTVIAVTAASQTVSSWPDWDQIDPRMCATWPAPNQAESELLRTPGRALKIHEKLSSPSRKRSLSESIKRHNEKLAKAQEMREKLLEEKAGKFKGIVKKVEEMKVRKEEQQMLLKLSMERKLQRAEEKRLQQLRKIVRKAHDEESKVIEIQFINSLEAQNKRHDILSKEKDHEARLHEMLEERQRRLEEKTAKETAAEERRKALEEERTLRMIELRERRKQKDAKIEQQLHEKEKERIVMAREKARDRQERISAMNAAHQANVEELQKKILLKQEESKRRHEENMEQIRQKAFELSVKTSSAIGNDDSPSGAPYETKKLCTLCQVVIGSEVFLFGHLRGKRHQDAIKEKIGGGMPLSEELEQFNLKHIIEIGKVEGENDNCTAIANIVNIENERLKASKKRCKKLKQRLIAKGINYENETTKLTPNSISQEKRILKLTKDLQSYSNDDKITGAWPSNMVQSVERIINELEKLLKNSNNEQLYLNTLNGLQLLCKLLSRIIQGTHERPTCLPDRVNVKLCNLILVACYGCQANSLYLLQSNCIMAIFDVFTHRCNLMDTTVMMDSSTSLNIQSDPVIASLCRLIAGIFGCIKNNRSENSVEESVLTRVQDVISFAVSSGLVDKLSCLMSNVRGPIDQTPDLAFLLESILIWINSMLYLAISFGDNDPTHLVTALNVTQIAGVVSLVYGVLLHSGIPQRSDENTMIPVSSSHELILHTLSVVLEAIKLCNYLALIDLTMVQKILGSEGLSLQLRHISSYLIWYCSQKNSPVAIQLLHEVILLIGNFVSLNKENQTVIQLGQRPTILQQLCSLPFEYFSDDKLTEILFPTLIVACFLNDDNRAILEQEMSTMMLVTFIESTIVDMQLNAVNAINTPPKSLVERRWTLASRFPKNKWNQAKNYFELN